MVPKEEYGKFYESYIKRFNGKDIINSLKAQKNSFSDYISNFSEDQANYRYNENKWSIAETLLHVLDAERVFSYRALCISRGERQSLIGFDQDDYVINSNAAYRTIKSLFDEFITVRNNTLSLFGNLSDAQLKRVGLANQFNISVRALAYIILGHCDHHFQILKERYS